VITARTGTPLAEVETALAERGQMLAFEPPRFGPDGHAGRRDRRGLLRSAPRLRVPRATSCSGVRVLDGPAAISPSADRS
jgi:glycolate oxidase FAD binding subunit